MIDAQPSSTQHSDTFVKVQFTPGQMQMVRWAIDKMRKSRPMSTVINPITDRNKLPRIINDELLLIPTNHPGTIRSLMYQLEHESFVYANTVDNDRDYDYNMILAQTIASRIKAACNSSGKYGGTPCRR